MSTGEATTTTADRTSGDRLAPVVLGLRALVAALAGTTAGIHLQLYAGEGYRTYAVQGHSWVGVLFLLNGIGGALLFLALFVAPRRLLPLVALAAVSLFALTLAGAEISVHGGLFGYQDSSQAPLFHPSVGVEIAGTVLALALTVLAVRRRAVR